MLCRTPWLSPPSRYVLLGDLSHSRRRSSKPFSLNCFEFLRAQFLYRIGNRENFQRISLEKRADSIREESVFCATIHTDRQSQITQSDEHLEVLYVALDAARRVGRWITRMHIQRAQADRSLLSIRCVLRKAQRLVTLFPSK